jgi:7,8-dihydro-6-hydroxymethylpterin-pyrophosphokinase
MATAKTVTKLNDKLTKINESFTINMYDNGYMVEAGGRNKKGDYVNAKILCNTLDEMLALVREAGEMERDV